MPKLFYRNILPPLFKNFTEPFCQLCIFLLIGVGIVGYFFCNFLNIQVGLNLFFTIILGLYVKIPLEMPEKLHILKSPQLCTAGPNELCT